MNFVNKNQSMKNNLVESITSKEKLKKALKYLKLNSKWCSKHSQNIYNSLTSYKELSFYGVILKNERNEISGSILTSYQGIVIINCIEYKVFNMFSWFVDKNERGYKSILLVKKLMSELSDSIITNVSPNHSAYSILKPMGFEETGTFTDNNYIFRYLYNSIRKRKWHSQLKLVYCKKEEYKRFELLEKKNSELIKIYHKNGKIELLVCKSKVFKRILGVTIYIPRLHILWTSSNSTLENNYHSILGLLFFSFKTPIISCHCFNKNENKKKKIWRKHLYKSPVKTFHTVPIIGSEYSIRI